MESGERVLTWLSGSRLEAQPPADERTKHLGQFRKDVVRIQPFGNLGFYNRDETPVWEDELEREPTAVVKGAESVAINVAHTASRNKFTSVLSLTNVNRSAAPMVMGFSKKHRNYCALGHTCLG